MMTAVGPNPDLLAPHRLVAAEEAAFLERLPESRRLLEEATALAGGVVSNSQMASPQAVWISHGKGSHVEFTEVLGPPHIEERVGLTGGHIFQGECTPDQM